MKRFVVIGLGRFGARLASNLAAAGEDVLGIDQDQEIIEEMRDKVTLAVSLDATDESALRMQNVDKADVAIVGIGHDFQSTVLTTVVLKQLGVKSVLARATSKTNATILSKIGADQIVSPEDESADKWTEKLINPQYLNSFELDEGHSIVEIAPPDKWIGQTLAELDLRAKQGLHVVAVKRPVDVADSQSKRSVCIPSPGDPILRDDILVLMGSDADLGKLPENNK